MPALMTTERLGLASGDAWRLRNLSLTLETGEILAVCGPNGAGKSTLLNLLAGELEATEGQISFQNKPLSAWSRQDLALVRARLEQHLQISFDFLVEEVVALGRFAWQEAPATTHEVVQQALQAAGADELQGRCITRLSGGERQRVHLARVLAQIWAVPEAVLLLDEPISAQDLGQQQLIFRNLRKLVEKHRWSVLVVLHDLNLAGIYADRIMLLEKGCMTKLGQPKEVLQIADLARIYSADLDIYHHSSKSGQLVMIEP